jgi:hypothetical protein
MAWESSRAAHSDSAAASSKATLVSLLQGMSFFSACGFEMADGASEVVRAVRRESLAHLGPPDETTALPQFHCSIMHRRGRVVMTV